MDILARIWENIGGRIGGPLTFRFVLQPTVASVLAILAGVQDAKAGRPPYFWTILTDASHRRTLLKEGWKAVVRVFILAVIMDVAYQIIEFRWIYPVEVLIVSFLLACIPYLLVRGPANRIAARIGRRRHQS